MEKELKLKSSPLLIRKSQLTPDIIMNTLFKMHTISHYFHLQTTSFAQHKMLDELYNELQEHKDKICEYLLGKQAPKRFGELNPHQVPPFSTAAVDMHLREGVEFCTSLCGYAETMKDEELCNLASDLLGVFIKAKYLNTLS